MAFALLSIIFLATLISSSTAIIMSTSNSNQASKINDIKCHCLIVDFDGTCTASDTTPILHKLATSFTNEDEPARLLREKTWNDLETEYFTEYSKAKTSIFDSDNTSIDIASALDIMDSISTKVTHKVSSSKVLKGIPTSTEDMISTIMKDKEISDVVNLRPRCTNTLSKAILSGWKFGVLSINWSQTIIDAVLLQPLKQDLAQKSKHQDSLELPLEYFWSNSIDENGMIDLLVPGAVDKQNHIRDIRNESSMDSTYIVYVGDSSTDLLAMLEADIGILIGQSQTSIEFAKRWGIKLCPLSERKLIGAEDDKTIWMTDNWDEIDLFLQGTVNSHDENCLETEI